MEDQQIVDPVPPDTGVLDFLPEFNLIADDYTRPENFRSGAACDADMDDFDIDNFDFNFDFDFDLKEFPDIFPGPVDSDPNSGDQSSTGANVYNTPSLITSYQAPGDQSPSVSDLLNLSSPESSLKSGNGDSQATPVMEYLSLESETPKRYVSESSSQGSGNCEPNLCESLNCPSPVPSNYARSAAFSPNHLNEPIVDPNINLKEATNCLLKRKKGIEDLNSQMSRNKIRRSHGIANRKLPNFSSGIVADEDEKRNARLMRNRESAQLSRQRKKQYVDELEDKMRTMQSTIKDLNYKISYIMAENASLRQQLSGGAMCPPQVVPHGMYPHPSVVHMSYPWAPYPSYVMDSRGSQVPLVPIPRLKSQQPASAPKTKKTDQRKTEAKSKKVASVSLLGLFFFILLFGGFIPVGDLMFEGTKDTVYGESYYPVSKLYDHSGRVLAVNGHVKGSSSGMVSRHDSIETLNCKTGHCERGWSNNELEDGLFDSGLPTNSSESLSAYLFVPRNDKLLKIDGNLIIHSVMASEKAMAHGIDDGKRRGGQETGLSVAGNVQSAVSHSGRNLGLNPRYFRTSSEKQMTLGTGPGEKIHLQPKSGDGKLQQWFKEGLSGPLLSSGMCKEVFQFDVAPGTSAIVPANSVVKTSSAGNGQNTTQFAKGKNRRILHSLPPIPLPGTNDINITKESSMGINPKKDIFHSNNSNMGMVVSVLVDPREASDVDGGVMRGTPKALSRIFVVVMVDSVKYITYSCMLPFKGL